MLEKIYLIDECLSMVQAWHRAFADLAVFEVRQADYFDQPADAIVSPANSFGIMDGGLDRIIRYELGFAVEIQVQAAIIQKFHGELPVGYAVTVATGHATWPWLIAAPTMRVPENSRETLNAYLAFRAVLLAVKQHNQVAKQKINSLVCSGLATGIGGLAPERCAAQMRYAYDNVEQVAKIPKIDEIWSIHHRMTTGQY